MLERTTPRLEVKERTSFSDIGGLRPINNPFVVVFLLSQEAAMGKLAASEAATFASHQVCLS